jgi:FHS family L-fucose permease-like MFS transporter
LGGYASLWLLLGIGLFNSIIWSNIFTLTISKQGKKTSLVSSLLIMAVVGGAILPLIQGWMIDRLGMRISFLIPVLGYSYLLFFGFFHLKNEDHEK